MYIALEEMMKRTTIMLPDQLKSRANQLAHQQGISLGELIRRALTHLCQRKLEQPRNAFFADEHVYEQETPSNLAKNHDDNLY